LVVAEAVFDADDDPVVLFSLVLRDEAGGTGSKAYHRLVNTTPKPKATKKSKGRLPPSLLFVLPLLCDAAGALADGVAVADDMSLLE